ncbi:MAG: hypothetical protein AAF559_10285 [Pseudomonadota bacterium]
MYSEDDINSAIAAGALSAEAAASFRSYMSEVRHLPRSSEENFKLINSFNDIFVSIGLVILLIAAGSIGQTIHPFLSGVLVAALAWPLAEFFTRTRRMALPSILLLLAFVGGVFGGGLGLALEVLSDASESVGALAISMCALVAAIAAYVHWRRFMVPITVAAGSAALAATIISLVLAVIGPDTLSQTLILSLVFVAGLAIFGFAMRWDISDRERITRRSDVAFWLHLLAAPMIAHPVFNLIGVTGGDNIGIGAAVGVLGVYVAFGVIALAIDRRALLVSALAYVLFALTFLFREFGAVELNFALTALVIGSALLSLSAFWQPIRSAVVTALPEGLQAKLPATVDLPTGGQPTAA